MYLIYSLLLTLGFILLLPRFVLDAFRNGKYVTGLRERLGDVPKIDANNRRVVWLHCVSVGEARAAQSLVHALTSRFPNLVLVISTTTVTGQKLAREIFRDHAAAIFFFPIDWAWTVRRVLRTLQPAAIFVMETEIWPRLFSETRKRDIPLALLNGRISDKSFRRYKLVAGFIARVLNDLSLAVMQSEIDAARICELGFPNSRVLVAGNLKFDRAITSVDDRITDEIRRRFGFDRERPVIVAASTHGTEEAVLLEAFKRIRRRHAAARLLVAPRHPERFKEVAALFTGCGFTFVRRSATPSAADIVADIVLLDSIGELGAIYPLADVAFVGGSIASHGGHSVIEPATLGTCTVTGPHTQNFAAVTKTLVDAGGLIQLPEAAEPAPQIAEAISELLSDSARRREIGRRAQAVCESNKGATDRTLEFISRLLAANAAQTDKEPSFSPLHATAAK